MTKKQAWWMVAIGAAVTATMVLVHLQLPIDQSWRTNRILHHVWQVAACLAAAGGVTWLLWPRPKASRRDIDREMARRRIIGVGVVVVAAVGLIVFSEFHREGSTRHQLTGPATEGLRAIGQALEAYAKDHAGARPAAIQDLVPKYIGAARLFYPYRAGPVAVEPRGEFKPDMLSYALAKAPPAADSRRRPETTIVAYLRPGNGWAPLTAVLEKDGRVAVVGEDEVRRFEEQFEPK